MKPSMAKIKENLSLKFQTTKDAEIEEAVFKAGDEVKVVHEWGNRFLVRACDGPLLQRPQRQD